MERESNISSFQIKSRIAPGKQRARSCRIGGSVNNGTRPPAESPLLSLTFAISQNEGKLSGGPKERKGRYSEPENGSATSPSSLPCTKSASLPELSRFTNSPDNSQSAESASTLDSSRGSVVAEAVGGIPSPVIAGFENLEITSTGDSNRLISTNPGAADPPHLAHGPSARTPAGKKGKSRIFPIDLLWTSTLMIIRNLSCVRVGQYRSRRHGDDILR